MWPRVSLVEGLPKGVFCWAYNTARIRTTAAAAAVVLRFGMGRGGQHESGAGGVRGAIRTINIRRLICLSASHHQDSLPHFGLQQGAIRTMTQSAFDSWYSVPRLSR